MSWNKEFADAVRPIYDGIFYSRPRPTTLWHYTDSRGALGIIKSQSIWLTNSSYLNDGEEMLIARSLLQESLKTTKGIASKDKPWIDALIAGLDPLATSTDTHSLAFISCFSGRRDDLSQWRAYGAGEGGISLGFDFSRVFSAKTTYWADRNVWLVPCIYGRADQVNLADHCSKILSKLDWRKIDKNPANAAEKALEQLSWAAACFKHSSFVSEDEWRIVLFADPDADLQHLQFSETPSLRPRLSYDFGRAGEIKNCLNEVLVGPQRHQLLAARSMNLLLLQQGYPSHSPSLSNTPFRSI